MKKNRLPEKILREMEKYTSFQRKVWLACAAIPEGETRSYGDIARAIGCPGAARAVGTALSKNPFAPIVPCHRVIKKNGAMGGFSAPGGIPAKVKLLEREGALGACLKSPYSAANSACAQPLRALKVRRAPASLRRKTQSAFSRLKKDVKQALKKRGHA